MTSRIAFALLFIFNLAPAFASNPPDQFPATITGTAGHRLEFSEWDERFGGWRKLEFHGAGAPFRMYFLAGAPGDANGGTVTETDTDYLSPDKKIVLIERKEFGLVYPPDEAPVNSEQNYCDAVSMETGCVLASESSNQCDGQWEGNRWKVRNGGIWKFDGEYRSPAKFAARARTYAADNRRLQSTMDLLSTGVGSYMACFPPENNVAAYNDIGFYLAQGGQHATALEIYQRLSVIAPDRVPLKLNIADSYWAVGQQGLAKRFYADYRQAMTRKGDAGRIPARVVERLAGVEAGEHTP
ncbi:hypothetical protein PMM47T1_00020 [Pseudomonas sp. M47T1]|uniref:tetratricopeptide repeat protein n=1 Tax=Pseudomonas sp. M47T1 TaxID=1179778 RepID=UPI0002606ABF|nr:hypothetical protein [Pseudomonas sp. M47T1]EIK98378.1 hypothetical protein PMM47T1_00020 [Pseudomonas sp. M47T1]